MFYPLAVVVGTRLDLQRRGQIAWEEKHGQVPAPPAGHGSYVLIYLLATVVPPLIALAGGMIAFSIFLAFDHDLPETGLWAVFIGTGIFVLLLPTTGLGWLIFIYKKLAPWMRMGHFFLFYFLAVATWVTIFLMLYGIYGRP